jgi:hypothetical protein
MIGPTEKIFSHAEPTDRVRRQSRAPRVRGAAALQGGAEHRLFACPLPSSEDSLTAKKEKKREAGESLPPEGINE